MNNAGVNSAANSMQQKMRQLQRRVEFLCDAELKQEQRGFSHTLCLSAQKPQGKFFVKVYQGDCRSQLQQVEQLYQLNKIPTAKLIETQHLDEINETIGIYEYLAGPTLKEFLMNANVKECEETGFLVGQEMQKFVQVSTTICESEIRDNFLAELDLYWQNIFQQKKQYLLTYQKQLDSELITSGQKLQFKKLPIINLHRLQKAAHELQNKILQTKSVWMHGDLNLSNVIIHNDKPYFIDTTDSRMGYRTLDFRGICWWGWTGNKIEKECAIYRGIFQGLFDRQIPESFYQELAFAVIYNLLWRVHKYHDDWGQIYYSFLRWHDILVKTNYFENYQFPWIY